MQRDLTKLSQNVYDLLIVGGGIYGACVAWDASLRGLSVALVEKADFGCATSANSLKMIHGGLRYLQYGDFKRMRESICDRRILMQIAPHLVHPLPVVVPTYGHGIKGKEVMTIALVINDFVSCDRNVGIDPQKHIHPGRTISKSECLQLLPGIDAKDLTAGAVFYDAQVYNSERLVLSFLRSAAQKSADLANYVEVTGFLQQGNCITGVEAQDLLTGDRFEIRAKTVVNTSGAWINRVLALLQEQQPQKSVLFAKAINLVTRQLFPTYAVGVPGQNSYQDSDALLKKGSSLLFIAPWRDKSLIGTSYTVCEQDPDKFKVTKKDIQEFLDRINCSYPAANLTRSDVSFVHGGLLPSSGVCDRTGNVQLSKHYQIYDYREQGLQGLISVVGVKYTTARNVAQKVVDSIFRSWGQKPPKSKSSLTSLHGGEISQFEAFLSAEIAKCPYRLGEEEIRRLIYNYGSAYSEVLKYLSANEREKLSDRLAVLKAEVLHGVREEMAQKLSDVVFRRTELASASYPGNEALDICAQTMGAELGWTSTQIQQELQEVRFAFEYSLGQERSNESKLTNFTASSIFG